MRRKVIGLCILALSIGLFCGRASFAQLDRTQEINDYIQTIQDGVLSHQILVAKKITRSGLTDAPLFDLLEKELLEGYPVASGSDPIDYMSWLCKALASSGQERYKATLEQVAAKSTSPKLQRYAKQSLSMIEEYAARSAIINQSSEAMSDKDPAVVQLINMLSSDSLELKRDAAKKITRNTYKDMDLFETVNRELLEGYAAASDSLSLDTMAWLCKALGASGNPKYKETLLKVRDSGSPKLHKYAGKGYDML